MIRREFTALLGLGLITGCAGRGVSNSTETKETPTGGSPEVACNYDGKYVSPTTDNVQVTYHPEDGGDSVMTSERVEISCVSDTGVNLEGATLSADGESYFQFGAVQLIPEQSVLVVSTHSGDSTVDTCPATLVRGAGLETRISESDQATVALKSPEGDVIESS